MKDFRHKTMGRLGNNIFQWAYLYAMARDKAIPDWYLQSESYFKPYQEEVKAILREGIGKIDKIAIHVRRGDYIGNHFYNDLSKTDYYKKAMAYFPKEKFLVFSDDIEWCKNQKIFKDCEFSEGYSEEEDINRIASCKGHIISNSSFAWWGAYLSPHGGKVIAPKEWFSNYTEEWRIGIPNTWKRI